VIRWPGGTRSRARRALSPLQREQVLRRCLAFLLDGDLAAVEDEIAALVRVDSRDVELYFLLGRLVHRSGDIGRAIRIHQNLLLRSDLDPAQRTRALCALGDDLESGGFLRRAVASFEEARERSPRDPEICRRLAGLYEGLGEYDRALEASGRWAKLTGLERGERDRLAARLWLAKARAEHEAGRSDAALRAARKALSRHREERAAQVLIGEIEAERGRNKAALVAWQAAVGGGAESDAQLYPLIASAFAALGRSRDFEKWLGQRLQGEPGDLTAREALARALSERGETEAAATELRRVLAADPSRLSSRLALAHGVLARRRDDEAAAELADLVSALEKHSGAGGEGGR